MELARTDTGCGFLFNATEAMDNGGWKRRRVERGEQRDPPRCLQDCKKQYLDIMSPGWSQSLNTACETLTTTQPNTQLWPLYWCDSAFCGLGVEQNGESGQDPNVDWIINTCQNVGYHSVIDPGPPPVQYSCQASPYNPSPYQGGPSSEAQLLQSTPSPSSTRILAESSSAPPLVSASPNSAVHATSASEAGGSLSPTTLSITNPGVPRATGSPTAMPTAPGGQVSSSAKIAIGVCSVIGLATAIGLLLFLLHRRRRRGGNGQMKSRIWVNRGFPQAGSPTPLIPATRRSKGVLAFPKPPPQLRDRRFLPFILRPGARSPSPPLTPLTPAYAHCNPVFPPSPICSPTANKLVPRHERTPKMYGMVPRPPPTLTYGSSTSGAHRRSQSSYTASSMTANSFRNDGSTMGTRTPPASPPRPPRPHEAPLEIPDLVRPGPPPSFGVASGRALSPAPLSGPRPPGPTSVPSSARGNDLPKNAQEIVDLTNEYAREVRGSWGSWSGVGGGGTGTTPSSSKKRAVSIKDADGNTARPATAGAAIAATAVLTEQELESIGGKY